MKQGKAIRYFTSLKHSDVIIHVLDDLDYSIYASGLSD
jgi:hypothetical protein